MRSRKKKRNIGAAAITLALMLIISALVALTPAPLGATMILEKSETFTVASSYTATLNIQVFDLGDQYKYAYTLTNNPDQPGFMIFAMSIGWGVSSAPVPIALPSEVVPGSGVDLRTPPVDDPSTLSTRIYTGSVPLTAGNSFDTVVMYFACGELTQHHISITSNKGGPMMLVTYDYPESSSIPEPATLLLLAGAVFTLGLVSRRRKMII